MAPRSLRRVHTPLCFQRYTVGRSRGERSGRHTRGAMRVLLPRVAVALLLLFAVRGVFALDPRPKGFSGLWTNRIRHDLSQNNRSSRIDAILPPSRQSSISTPPDRPASDESMSRGFFNHSKTCTAPPRRFSMGEQLRMAAAFTVSRCASDAHVEGCLTVPPSPERVHGLLRSPNSRGLEPRTTLRTCHVHIVLASAQASAPRAPTLPAPAEHMLHQHI